MTKKQSYLKRKQTFSGAQVLLFVLIFATVGAVAIWRSLAAGNPYIGNHKKETPISLYESYKHIEKPVEQQTLGWTLGPCPTTEPNCQNDQSLWVVNPTVDCPWDVDDGVIHTITSSSGPGSLSAGGSISDSICEIADCAGIGGNCAPWHEASVYIRSSASNLQISIGWTPGQSYNVPAPSWDTTNKVWVYSLCQEGPSWPRSSWQSIANSNGGSGVPSKLTLNITNPGASTAYDITGNYSLMSDTLNSGPAVSACATAQGGGV